MLWGCPLLLFGLKERGKKEEKKRKMLVLFWLGSWSHKECRVDHSSSYPLPSHGVTLLSSLLCALLSMQSTKQTLGRAAGALLEGEILPWACRGCLLQVAHGAPGSWVWHRRHQDAAALTLRLYISKSVPGSALLSTLTDLLEGRTPYEQSYGVWEGGSGCSAWPCWSLQSLLVAAG